MEEEKTTTLLFIYEPEQIEPALDYVKKIDQEKKPVIVALDYEVEMDLKKIGIPFHSIKRYCKEVINEYLLWEQANELARVWYTSPGFSFYEYRGIKLGGSAELSLSFYFGKILYYLDAIEQILEAFPGVQQVLIPESSVVVTQNAGPTAQFEVQAVADVVKLLEGKWNISARIISFPRFRSPVFFILREKIVTFCFETVLFLFNTFINFLRPGRSLKLFVIDTWEHIEPFIKKMNNVELVMLERKEMWKARAAIWSKKIRFHHKKDFITRAIKKTARQKQEEFTKKWKELGDEPSFASLFKYRGISFWPLAQKAFEHLVVSHAEEMVIDIESLKKLMLVYKINEVLLRASSNGLMYLMACLTKELGITTIELQHALEDVQSSSASSRVFAEYLAAYGKLTKDSLASMGNDPRGIIEIGSPRFDRYPGKKLQPEEIEILRARLGLDSKRPVVLFIVPPIMITSSAGHFDSYKTAALFRTLAIMQERIPGLQIILKLRPWGFRKNFYQKAAASIFVKDAVLTHYENIGALFCLSDVVVTHYSTVVLEAMLNQKPVVIYGLKEDDFWLQEVKRSGAVRFAGSEVEIIECVRSLLFDVRAREDLIDRANRFLQRNYLFDGEAAERMIEFLNHPQAVS